MLTAATAAPWPLVISASLVGWTGLIVSAQGLVIAAYCSAAAGYAEAPAWGHLETALRLNPPAGLGAHWLLMLLAMMPLLVAEPLRHLWRRSLARRRLRAVATFATAYTAGWMLAGIPLVLGALGLRAFAGPELLYAVITISVALLWQLTPAKQTCLNRCHRQPRLAAFGLAADRDCLRYGLLSAVWCIGACWALMLVPLLVEGAWHLVVMAALSSVLIAERQAAPRPARWGLLWPAF